MTYLQFLSLNFDFKFMEIYIYLADFLNSKPGVRPEFFVGDGTPYTTLIIVFSSGYVSK